MKALITAAGIGSRMGKLTKDTNKCAIEVGGLPLIQRLVDSLEALQIKEIFVVVGYKKNTIKNILGDRVTYLENSNYANTGILTSILKAKDFLKNSDFLFMTGDSVMSEYILKKIIETTKKKQIVVSIEEKICNEEDCKVILKDNKFIEISKTADLKESIGEFTGLIKVDESLSNIFFKTIQNFVGNEDKRKLLGSILVTMQSLGYNVEAQFTEDLYRTEIDFKEDLEKANRYFQN